MNRDWVIRETWLYRINPTFKLVVLISMFIFILFVHVLNWLSYLTIISFVLLWLYSGLSKKVLFLLVLPFLVVFISTASSMILFGKGENIWFQWGLIQISEESFYRGIHLGFRAFIFATLGLLFALTTKPVMLFYSLMQQVRLKPKYAYSFMAGFRLIPIMVEEFFTIQNAMKVRGVKQKKGLTSFFRKLKAYSIPLLAGSIRRAHRIAIAMEAKRFTANNHRTFYYEIRYSKYDALFFSIILIIIFLSFYLSTILPIFSVGDVRYGK